MATTSILSEHEYLALALDEPERNWELWDGVLVEKPPMSMLHNDVAFYLGHTLASQLDRGVSRVNVNGDRTRIFPRSYFIPDVVVIPAACKAPFEHDPRAFAAYAEPLPLIVEIWSPSTGRYDLVTKLDAYRRRGDLEIWHIHPYERTLTAWRKQPDGSYSEALYTGGIVPVASLPGVSIDLDTLLDG